MRRRRIPLWQMREQAHCTAWFDGAFGADHLAAMRSREERIAAHAARVEAEEPLSPAEQEGRASGRRVGSIRRGEMQ